MGVGEAFKEDGEAVARVRALFERLSENGKPFLPRLPELRKRMEANIDARANTDLATMWVAGKQQGAADAMRAVFGYDNVFFHDEAGPARVEFGEESDPNWWRQFFPK